MAALLRKDNCLLQAATGAGKTIVFASLISRWLKAYPAIRIIVLAHRQELINQAYEKLIIVDPLAWRKTGRACAGLGRVMTQSQVIIGSLQTLVNRDIEHDVHLLIVDECHRMPPKDKDSQYKELIERLKERYPKMRLLGVTATPFRLGHGYIYGGENDWFEELDYSINMKELIEAGFLAPIRFKINTEKGLAEELAQVKKSGGEYQIDPLADVMCKKVFLDSAVTAWKEYGEGRRRVVIFAVTIEHGELLMAAFRAAGQKACVVHSRMKNKVRRAVLAAFERGEYHFIINVGILTEGWDSPQVDLIMMARPTLSPGLYVQMIGRGSRIHEGKENLLVLDLVNNSQIHGLPWEPKIKNKGSSDWVYMPVCPECKEVIEDKKARFCPVCGYEFPEPEEKEKEAAKLVDVLTVKMRELQDDQEVRIEIERWSAAPYVSARGNKMLRVTIQTALGKISEYLDFEGQGSQWGQTKAQKWWLRRANMPIPETVDEAADRIDEIKLPHEITIKNDNGYLRVTKWF